MAMSYDAVSRRIVQFQRISVDGNMVEQKIMLDYRTVINCGCLTSKKNLSRKKLL